MSNKKFLVKNKNVFMRYFKVDIVTSEQFGIG